MAVEIKSGDILSSEHLTKHMKIFAGPGAGKTHFLVENIKNIIVNNSIVSRSKARKVLCITYTNAAVEEIKRRLDRFSNSVVINTIHGFIIEHIIAPFQQDLKKIMLSDFGINVNNAGKITSQIEGVGILHGYEREEIYKFITDITSENIELSYSKKAMGNVQVDNEKYLSDNLRLLAKPSNIADNHIKAIKEFTWSIARKLTHDEILYFGYRILQENSTALYATRVKFPFIFIDEFQDTNPLQTKLIKLIGEKSTIIGVIGDVAQSIYSFQGARPSQFLDFLVPGDRELVEYTINGNRRSTNNVVNFCNLLRSSDKTLTQKSIRPYINEIEKETCESCKVVFLLGSTTEIMKKISQIIEAGGVVLTRAWAAAFQYIQGIDSSQVDLLKKIYNSYYNSPIDIRAEISEHNNVMWVRSFRFIFLLWEGYRSGSFIDIIKAFSLYAKTEKNKIAPCHIIQIKNLLTELFKVLSDTSSPVQLINNFNLLIAEPKYSELKEVILGQNLNIPCFSEYDDDKLIQNISNLTWETAYKLFSEVFSENSKYMTVHQAKGLEWDKVVVSVTPNNFDKTNLKQFFSNPQLLQESSAEEFARMYYVACSRAKSELYIHLSDISLASIIKSSICAFHANNNGMVIDYVIENC